MVRVVSRKDHRVWFRSAKEGRSDTLSELYDSERIEDVDMQDSRLRTALYFAAKNGHTTCAEILLHRGANPNRHSKRGTPAHAAARSGQVELLELLVDNGAFLGARDHVMRTVLHVAGKSLSDAQVKRLVHCADRRVLVEFIKRRPAKFQGTRRQPGIPAPLPRVPWKDLDTRESRVLARGPDSEYVTGRFRDSDVTLKVCVPERDAHEQMRLFLNEVDVACQLRHPNIVQLLAACSPPSPRQGCLVLEPIEGIFLHRLSFVEKQTLYEDTILGIARDVACAMQYVHQRGFLHCYLGSHSVTLDQSNRAKICNFEYALPVVDGDSSQTPITHCLPLYEYMAPEQLCGKAADKPGDVFSFGLMVWECATAKRPLDKVENFEAIVKNRRDPRVKQMPNKWSHRMVAIVSDCLVAAELRPTFSQLYEWLEATLQCRYVGLAPSSTWIENYGSFFPVRDDVRSA